MPADGVCVAYHTETSARLVVMQQPTVWRFDRKATIRRLHVLRSITPAEAKAAPLCKEWSPHCSSCTHIATCEATGISGASIVHDDDKLKERVEFIQRTTDSTAIAEQFIEGREIYVGVMGNDRVTVLPAWEFAMTKKEDGAPLIASGPSGIPSISARWDSRLDRPCSPKRCRPSWPSCPNKSIASSV
jgi:hypothetical protein